MSDTQRERAEVDRMIAETRNFMAEQTRGQDPTGLLPNQSVTDSLR
jgi:hypothetical protein